MQERTKMNLRDALIILLRSWENGEKRISENEIAKRLTEEKELPKSIQKTINNIFSPDKKKKEYSALFYTVLTRIKRSNLNNITLNGIFWLFREDFISFEKFLDCFFKIAQESITSVHPREELYEYDEGDNEFLNRVMKARKEEIRAKREFISRELERFKVFIITISRKNGIFEEASRKYLQKFNLEGHPFTLLEYRCIICNLLLILFNISKEYYIENLVEQDLEGIYKVIDNGLMPFPGLGISQKGELEISLTEVFEIPINPSTDSSSSSSRTP